MKVCTKCKRQFPEVAFGSDRKRKDGLQVYCKTCLSKIGAAKQKVQDDALEAELASLPIEQLFEKPLYLRSLGLAQRGLKFCKCCNAVKARGEFSPMGPKKPNKLSGYCRGCHRERQKNDRILNPDKQKIITAKLREKRATDPVYADKKRTYCREYMRKPKMRLISRFRSHNKILSRMGKPESTSTLLGGKAKDIVAHLTNGGTQIPYGHDIDHHVPVAYFNLENDFQRLVCFNWRNLRLLPTSVNRGIKRDNLPGDFEEHLTRICSELGFPANEVLLGKNKKYQNAT